ncbi:MAG TPA: DNA double-strand break repair nuclease NurA [Oscillatoriaceae cyanobacterium]
MLDIRALNQQIHAMTADLFQQADASSERLEAALALLRRGAAENSPLLERLEAFAALREPPWMVAQPAEALETTRALPALAAPYSVVATDGSQIAPSHHEIALCYLLNVGRILYTYGTGERPLQDSFPQLFHREADMRPSVGRRRVSINEELIAAFRNLHEAKSLVGLAEMACERGHPAIAMQDGTLIQWMLEDKPEDFQDELLEGHLEALNRLRDLRVPVVGYLSSSRATDVVNLLRLVACPKARLECERCAWNEPPCEGHVPLSDRRMWARRLAVGERSPIFYSTAKILAKYGAHRVAFFYLHVGAEVARLEVPLWVAEDDALLDRVHAYAYDQAQKGMGYPISLQEAHNQAVVSREDRQRFFSLLSQRMQQAGMTVAVSNKQLKKRVGVV